MTFKKLIVLLAQATTAEDMQAFYAQVDRSYQSDKITFADNELLYALGGKVHEGITGERFVTYKV